MTKLALSKREIRERSAQLSALMCQWDPIGIMGDPEWRPDEYDCLVGPLLTLLDSGASKDEIARYLCKELDEHFGLSSDNYDSMGVAEVVPFRVEESLRAGDDLHRPVG